MTKVKVSQATGPVLDYMVAKAFGGTYLWYDTIATWWIKLDGKDRALKPGWAQSFTPSTDWSQGGPIIERLMLKEGLVLRCWVERGVCQASLDFPYKFSSGPTPLIAAMRCYVASKLGDEVGVPEELLT